MEMREQKREKAANNEPLGLRDRVARTPDQRPLPPRHELLPQGNLRGSDGSSADAHASMLKRATASHPTRVRQTVLQLQSQYGNGYVGRVLALAKTSAPGLYRKCGCAGLSEPCDQCRDSKLNVQRLGTDRSDPSNVTSTIDSALRASGQLLDSG